MIMMRSAGQSRARGGTIWGHLLRRWTMSRYQLVVNSKDYSSSSPRAQAERACALRALGLLMADGAPKWG